VFIILVLPDALVIFITRIPTHYNDGTPVPKAVLDEITDEVFEAFGGCTLEGPGTGVWRDDQGKVYAEQSFRLEVACDRSHYPEAREMVLRIGQRLGQKAMYFEVRYFDGAEILDLPQTAADRDKPKQTRRKRPKQ
jgi:hypothetical protein